ncbi:MAG: hypothetical protein BIFFINMI_03494 [Phycisphaerae bacterium]|nr:hypothetical protein [Phycisphaerae bacterium]
MAWADCHSLRSVLTLNNRAATRPDHPCADLRTRYLVMDRPRAWRCVQTCIERLGKRWRIEDETPASGTFHMACRSRWRMFTDDVKVSLWPAEAGSGSIAVDLMSSSRTGRCDFGRCARNIVDFYRALEAYLQLVPGRNNGSTFDVRRSGSEEDKGQAAGPDSTSNLDL